MSEIILPSVSGIVIDGTAVAFPSPPGRMVSNAGIHEELYGPDWKQKMQALGRDIDYVADTHGYRERYWTSFPPKHQDDFGVHNMMIEAGGKVLTDSPGSVDALIAVTTTPSRYTTSMASLVAGALELDCPIFDVKAGCTSWIYALSVAAGLIHLGSKRILLTGAEIWSPLIRKGSSLLYAAGDGGAAVILSKSDAADRGIEGGILGGRGTLSGLAGVKAPLTAHASDFFFDQDPEMEKYTMPLWESLPARLREIAGVSIDWLVPHQVNQRSIQAAIRSVGLSEERVITIVDRIANCGSVSIAIALHELFTVHRNDLSGKRVMLAAVGGGLTYGGLVFRL